MRLTVSRLSAAAVLALSVPLHAQTDYTLAFEPGGKLWRVEAHLPGRGEDALDFWIPLWTPGAYHEAEYGRFVRNLSARDEQGKSLTVERDGDSHFVVRGGGKAKEIVVAYEAEPMSSGVFTNNVIDVESNRIRADYAYVNPASLFGFVPARANEAVRLAVTLPSGWKAATVLQPDEAGRFLAPSYYRFEDSPLLFSPTIVTRTFEVDGVPHAVSVHGKSAEDVGAIATGCKRIVEASTKRMHGLPYDRYSFLYAFVPEGGGSELEHSFSTLILVTAEQDVAESDREFWGITAHEYFHLWCAERIHVQEIEKVDLTQPLETGTIWVNEGITEYFCRHLLFDAGFYGEEELLETYLARGLPPGMMPKASWTSVSRAAASWGGMNDLMVFAMRMYMAGPPTIFALDMTMRRATNGEKGVQDLLLYLMANYVKLGRGFGEDELDDILEKVASAPAVEFYKRYIDGDEIPDPAQFLDVIGYRYDPSTGLAELEPASAAQLRARRDYFSPTGEP